MGNGGAHKPVAAIVPLIIGPGNALAATGFGWRWCRDFWQARGRAFVGTGRKRGIPAQALLAELELAGADATLPSVMAPLLVEDAAEAVRRAIGVSSHRVSVPGSGQTLTIQRGRG